MIPEKLFLKTLEKLKFGTLELVSGNTRRVFGDGSGELAATVVVERPEFFAKVLFGGEDGAGEAYMAGDWWSPDLVSVIRIASRNLRSLAGGNRLLSSLSRIALRARHKTRGNTVNGSRKNIAEHYDLSNDFFRLFLDERMVYSSAVYETETDTLEDAPGAKTGPDVQEAGVDAGRSSAGNRHRVGRLRGTCGAALRMPRHHHDHQS